ncbi:hypothetical protein [Parvicella tangerina]|uniref:Glycosyltransferase n=1 Tax=Parvicella tangerina TaxID=2829795 RepID=A0A916JLX9_9FLAO|nr:hypothetical protein [Parvicella tangerina]CAG5079763.1 hypothetical protein CRYO30217_01054 [Parvicella tangerina]
MRAIDYITYNDVYGGIYQSQVIDVVKKLNSDFDSTVSLKAFVPLKLWREQSKLIKNHLPDAKVYPILGRVSSISRTKKLIKKNNRVAICRGPLAFELARSKYGKCIYDGRAAVRAEVQEYNVAGSAQIGEVLINAEVTAVQESDAIIAVSNKLISYWEEYLKLDFDRKKVVVIPCTLSTYFNEEIRDSREADVVRIVYSGGIGPWQSFDKVTKLLATSLKAQSNLKALFLTKEHEGINKLIENFPGRVERKWLKHHEVSSALSACDYGILIRENNWTNKVASPVKFAEYLKAGLKVLISKELGDFSEVVSQENLGVTISDSIPELRKPTVEEKKKSQAYCVAHLTKDAPEIKSSYESLLSLINNE